jgi:hypothetical protein
MQDLANFALNDVSIDQLFLMDLPALPNESTELSLFSSELDKMEENKDVYVMS